MRQVPGLNIGHNTRHTESFHRHPLSLHANAGVVTPLGKHLFLPKTLPSHHSPNFDTTTTTQFSLDTTQFSPDTTQFSLDTTLFSLDTTQFSPDTTQFSLDTTQFSLDTTLFSLDTTQFSLDTTQFSLDTTQFSLDTTQFSPDTTQFSPDTTQFSLHTTHFSLDTTTVELGIADRILLPALPLKELNKITKACRDSGIWATIRMGHVTKSSTRITNTLTARRREERNKCSHFWCVI